MHSDQKAAQAQYEGDVLFKLSRENPEPGGLGIEVGRNEANL